MSAPSTTYVYLAPNPKSAYKSLFITGTRIPARALYGLFACEEPRSIEQIAADFELPEAAVREAIAYCEANPPELLADYARQEALAQATGMNDPDYKSRGKPKLLSAEEMAELRR